MANFREALDKVTVSFVATKKDTTDWNNLEAIPPVLCQMPKDRYPVTNEQTVEPGFPKQLWP